MNRMILLVAGLCLVTACSSPPEDHSAHTTETVTAPAPAGGPATTATATAGPSFDCAKAASEAEKMVCGDPELAALDRQLADEYRKAENRPQVDKASLVSMQNGWVSGRDDCWKDDDQRRCVLEAYRTRIFELRVSDPTVPPPTTVTYQCPGDKPFTATFYDDFDPKIADLRWGEDSAVTFAEPSGSGTKYGREGVQFWEHQGEVTVDFYGNEFVCRVS